MKLFSPTQSKVANDHKQEDAVAQIAYLSVTLKKLQDSINLENQNFEKRMQEQRQVYGEEKEHLQDDLRALEASVAQKEHELVELLVPVEEYAERAKGTLSKAQMKAISIMTREEEIAGKEELLQEKLDEVSEREIIVAENEIKIESRLKGIEDEAQMVSTGHKLLNEDRSRFEIERREKEKTLQEKESSITIIERRNREYLENRTKELNDQEKALKDKREALDRAFSQVEKLKEQYNKK